MRWVPALLILALATPVAAQTSDDIVTELELRGYHIGEGVDVAIDDMEDLVDRYEGYGFVALDPTPPGGADLLANELLETAPSIDTVVVLTAEEAGAASAVFSDDQLDDAFDAAFATSGDPYVVDFDEVAAALEGVPPATPDGPTSTLSSDTPATTAVVPATDGTAPPTSGGGGGIPWILLLVVGGVGFMVWRGSRRGKEAVADRVATAKAEIEAQMAAVAEGILAMSDDTRVVDHPEASGHFRAATDTFGEAEQRLATATTEADLELLSDDLDVARWNLAAAAAVAAGDPVPPKPEDESPPHCFFDPTHGAGTEQAEIKTATGTRTVAVCAADADRLRRGERPTPRHVDVGGSRVPSATAPKSHGGLGLDLGDLFEIVLRGGAAGVPLDWRRSTRSRPSTGGGWTGPGGPIFPKTGSTRTGRSVTSRSRSRRTGSAGTRSRSGRVGRSRSTGRARRSR